MKYTRDEAAEFQVRWKVSPSSSERLLFVHLSSPPPPWFSIQHGSSLKQRVRNVYFFSVRFFHLGFLRVLSLFDRYTILEEQSWIFLFDDHFYGSIFLPRKGWGWLEQYLNHVDEIALYEMTFYMKSRIWVGLEINGLRMKLF